MNNSEKRQMIDEIHFLNKTKRHRAVFGRCFRSHFSSEMTLESILDDKRRAYNYQLTNIYRKYNVDYDNLYYALDSIWNILCTEKDKKAIHARVTELANTKHSVVGLGSSEDYKDRPPDYRHPNWFAALSVLAIAAGPLLFTYTIVKMFWSNYLLYCLLYSKEYIWNTEET